MYRALNQLADANLCYRHFSCVRDGRTQPTKLGLSALTGRQDAVTNFNGEPSTSAATGVPDDEQWQHERRVHGLTIDPWER